MALTRDFCETVGPDPPLPGRQRPLRPPAGHTDGPPGGIAAARLREIWKVEGRRSTSTPSRRRWAATTARSPRCCARRSRGPCARPRRLRAPDLLRPERRPNSLDGRGRGHGPIKGAGGALPGQRDTDWLGRGSGSRLDSMPPGASPLRGIATSRRPSAAGSVSPAAATCHRPVAPSSTPGRVARRGVQPWEHANALRPGSERPRCPERPIREPIRREPTAWPA